MREVVWRIRFCLLVLAVFVTACTGGGAGDGDNASRSQNPGAESTGEGTSGTAGGEGGEGGEGNGDESTGTSPGQTGPSGLTTSQQIVAAREHLEAIGGDYDWSTHVDGTTTTNMTFLHTANGSVATTTKAYEDRSVVEEVELRDSVGTLMGKLTARTTVEFVDGDEVRATITDYEDGAGNSLGTDETGSAYRLVPPDQRYLDANGYSREPDGAIGDASRVRRPPLRTLRLLEDLGTPADPLTLATSFDYEGWAVTLSGITTTLEPFEWHTEPGTCYLLYGTVQPLQFDYALSEMSNVYEAPAIQLSIDGTLHDSDGDFFGEGLRCDVLPAVAADYTKVDEGEVVLGAVYPVYATWFVPEGSTAEHLVVGDPDYYEPAYFRVDQLVDSIDAPDLSDSQPTVTTREIPVDHEYESGRHRWQLTIDAIEPVGFTGEVYAQEYFTCWLIMAEATLLEVDQEIVVEHGPVEWRDLGALGVVASGRFREDGLGVDDCDESTALDAGYETFRLANEIQLGDTIRFYVPLYLESSLTPDMVAIGRTFPVVFLDLPE